MTLKSNDYAIVNGHSILPGDLCGHGPLDLLTFAASFQFSAQDGGLDCFCNDLISTDAFLAMHVNASVNSSCTRGLGICQPRGYSRAFKMHMVSYQNITTQRILLEKKSRLAHLSRTGVVKACSRFYACISSLLIKPELYSKTRELSTWINVG